MRVPVHGGGNRKTADPRKNYFINRKKINDADEKNNCSKFILALQYEDCRKSGEPVGRTLDFLAQEMNREINTIGSKANDAVISREVVTLKAELEKFREQAMNVE